MITIKKLPCPNAIVRLNGDNFLNVASGSTTDVILEYENGNLVQPIEIDGSVIVLPNQNDWVRPSEWLPMPEITLDDTKVAILYAVYENRTNLYYLNFTTVSGSFSNNIDWGDGSSSTITNTNVITHEYIYDDVNSIILVDDFGENYKQVLIIITNNSGIINGINFGNASSISRNNSLDIIGSWSTVRFLLVKSHPLLNRLELLNYNYNSVNMNGFFNSLPKLRILNLAKPLGTPTSFSNVFNNVGNFRTGNLEISSAITCNGAFSNSMIESIGNITALSVASFSSGFNNCFNLKTVGDINMPSVGTFASCFFANFSLVSIGLITSTNATTITNCFDRCLSLVSVRFSSLANVTSAGSAFNLCHSLAFLRVPNIKVTFSLSGCALEKDEIVQVFNDLFGLVVGQTITITGNPGVANLTASDILIATSKGWTVVL